MTSQQRSQQSTQQQTHSVKITRDSDARTMAAAARQAHAAWMESVA